MQKKRSLMAMVLLAAVLYCIMSVAIAFGTQTRCDSAYPKHWNYFPPSWECAVASP